jgi:hypothetical protein
LPRWEEENRRLKKLLAEAVLDNAALKDRLGKNGWCLRRGAGRWSGWPPSERRACRLIGCVRSTARYRCQRPDDAVLRERLRALAAERRRFGYRRLGVLLAREGLVMIVSDNGTELTSNAILRWTECRVALYRSRQAGAERLPRASSVGSATNA